MGRKGLELDRLARGVRQSVQQERSDGSAFLQV